MKHRKFYCFFVIFFIASISYSQVRYGIRASGSITNLTKVHAYSKSRGGFQIAFLSQIPFSNNDIFFFQPEINYSAQGEFDQPYATNGQQEKQKVFLNYINVPLNFKVYFTDSEDEFFAVGGPYIGFLISKSIELRDYPTEAENNKFNTFDFGLTLGVGFSLNRQLELSLRYSYGFADQVSNDPAKTKNSTSILNLGASFIFN